jgi:hypothetical protein
MSIGPLVNLAAGAIQSIFSHSHKSTNAPTVTSTLGSNQDTNQLSPFAQVLSSLQQLQQSSPSQYQQVTQQISNSLQKAAQSATASGNTGLATELTQLSTDFRNASTSGQSPNLQDLAKAIGSGHHHHHHGGAPEVASDSGSSANSSLNPLSIISSTLSSAGVQIG